ncbi:MAG: M23 family metallopeptidase [Thermoanaerobaculia bacterium]
MIEIQIHPSDIRRKVRYLFLDRRTVTLVITAGFVLLGIVVGSMFAAPTVIRRNYRSSHLSVMRQQRVVQSRRLQEHVTQMSALERALDDQRVRVEKLITVYGLDEDGWGQGGTSAGGSKTLKGVDLALHDALEKELQLRASTQRLVHQVEMLAQYEAANSEMVRHIPSILPLPADRFVLTSPFGKRISPFTRRPDAHRGLDLAAPSGTPVYATADGVVTFSGRYPLRKSVAWWRFGNVVVLRHSDRFITIYAHCDTVNVRPGQTVRQGDIIARVGSTGWSTNSHLHYEVRTDLQKAGQFIPVDPRIYILNYRWNDEERLLIQARTSSKDYNDFDPLPTAFTGGRRRG